MNIRVIDMTVQPTLGNLIGTMVPDEIISNINSKLQNIGNNAMSVYNYISEEGKKFISKIVNPIKQQAKMISSAILEHADVIKPITCEKDLENIPMAMHLPIVLYKPVRDLLEQGRIFGFGIDPSYLGEDYYGRLIDNGKVEDVLNNLIKEDDKYYVEFNYKFKSTDPDLEIEELEFIEETRNYLDKILKETKLDPTDYPNLRG